MKSVPANRRHTSDRLSFIPVMDILLGIAGAIALLALAALFIYLILFMKEAKVLLSGATKTLNDISAQVNQQLQNVDGVVKNVGKLTDNLTEVVDDATDIIHEGRKVVISILELEQTLQQSIQAPIVEAVSVLGALGKGIRAFRQRLAARMEPREEEHYEYEVPEETAEVWIYEEETV